jgi:hypothetical protein
MKYAIRVKRNNLIQNQQYKVKQKQNLETAEKPGVRPNTLYVIIGMATMRPRRPLLVLDIVIGLLKQRLLEA